MHKRYTLKWLMLFLAILESAHSLEIFIKKTAEKNDQNTERLASFANKTYQIPLFQTRYLAIRLNPDDLRRDGDADNQAVAGFKFQVKSTDSRVIDVRKEIMVPTTNSNGNSSSQVLLEDLFICE
jgi:hypothetical protein